MAKLSALIDEYLKGPAIVREAVAGMSRDHLLARPVAGKWSTLEVVAHLADFDPILAERMKRIIALERPTFLGADENLFVTHLAYHDRDLEEELAIIDKTRQQLARILRKLPESVLGRIGVHNERGPKTLEQMLTGATNHITHHVKFITEKRQALGLPT